MPPCVPVAPVSSAANGNTIGSLECWAARVAAAAQLPDERLNSRLEKTLTMLGQHSDSSIPQAAGDFHQAKGIYRFFDNKRFTQEPLVDAFAQTTVGSCADCAKAYAAHDSSSLNYSSLKCTTGLGRLGDSQTACGLIVHSVLAITGDGVVRGLLDVDLWHRPVDKKTKEQRYDRAFEDKESFKWVRGLRAAHAAFESALPAASRPRLIHLMDREADIHEVFAEVLALGDGAVIRCAQNRKVDGQLDRAHAAVAASPLLGTTTLELPAKAGQPKRTATLQLRAVRVLLTPSQRDYPGRQPLHLNLIEARECQPPTGCTPIRWLLWTTEAIATLADVLERLREYALRWRIEEYHLTLKSGCATEDLLLETAQRLYKAIVLYAGLAARILTMRDLGRQAPQTPCTVLLSTSEWRVLAAHFQASVTTVPSIEQAMKWIGRLGGHLARKRDSLPGVRTLWRGWRDLHMMVQGYNARQRLDG